MRKEKGSIAVFALVALLFMSAFLIILYAGNVNKSKIVKEQFNIISEIYSKTDYTENIKLTVTNVQDKVISTTENTEVYDEYGNKIIVPAGFKITTDATHVTEGIVIEDVSANNETSIGNQFVWIPVGNIKTSVTDTVGTTITLGRYSWSESTATLVQPIEKDSTKSSTSEVEIASGDNSYTELQPTATGKGPNGNAIARNINDFYISASTNGGYYIGRYEAGDSDATVERVGTDGTSTPGTLVCKSNQYVYNWITQPDASDKCKSMYVDGYNSGTYSSDLINSYAWDTAIVFIQTFSTEEDASSYASLNKSTSFAKTGVNPDKYCNIYDMSGNGMEWTTEEFSDVNSPCTRRGGSYVTHIGDVVNCTSYRSAGITTDSSSTVSSDTYYSFRPLLYVAI